MGSSPISWCPQGGKGENMGINTSDSEELNSAGEEAHQTYFGHIFLMM